MALLQMNFQSRCLLRQCGMTLLMPQVPLGGEGLFAKGRDRWQVLYLLHGMYNNHTSWIRETSIERYANKLPLLVVMPDAENSFYMDLPGGTDRYWTFLTCELPKMLSTCFPISTAREDTFVAGVSMGGYGAMRLALLQPERFAAAACLSAPLDILAALQILKAKPEVFSACERVFGNDGIKDESMDLFALAERVREQDAPKLYLACGTEDPMLEGMRAFKDRFERKLSITYAQQSGAHEWSVWDSQIQRVLEWLPISTL